MAQIIVSAHFANYFVCVCKLGATLLNVCGKLWQMDKMCPLLKV